MKRFVDLDSAAQYNIFNAVKELKESGLGYKRIIKKLREEKEINLSLGTLSYWFNNNVKMVGGENYFETKPSRELSYVLGVLFGDGSLSLDKRKQEYKIRLDAIDYDFVEKFSASVSKLLGKERYYSICYPKKKIYSTQIQSKQLYYFIKSIKENFDKGKPFIETYPAEFIMGLADSEGTSSFSPKTSWINVVVAHSANLALLRYVKWLLFEKFGVQSKLRRVKTAGMRDSVIDG
ncbi:hypothetical protein KKE06_01635, partial [Candidatus Micrarchaeota archaeon]|nr:hypothetical protein [Candidatus Micrarchaeota archaeon]MBU1930548.1 hypothetical protein [Candidatus Micrarchaeota archaeon]